MSYNIIKMLFSKNWKIKEKALKSINDEISKYPKISNKIFDKIPIGNIYFAIFYSTSIILSTQIIPLIINSINLLNLTITKFANEIDLKNLIQKKKSDTNLITVKILEILLEKNGDANSKIKENAGNLLLEFCASNLFGDFFVMDVIINGNSKRNLFLKNNKLLFSKLNLVNKIINLFGVKNFKGNLFNNLIEFAFESFGNLNKEIRQEAIEVLYNIYLKFNFNFENKRDFANAIKKKDVKMFSNFLDKLALDPNSLNDEIAIGLIDEFNEEFTEVNNNNNNSNVNNKKFRTSSSSANAYKIKTIRSSEKRNNNNNNVNVNSNNIQEINKFSQEYFVKDSKKPNTANAINNRREKNNNNNNNYIDESNSNSNDSFLIRNKLQFSTKSKSRDNKIQLKTYLSNECESNYKKDISINKDNDKNKEKEKENKDLLKIEKSKAIIIDESKIFKNRNLGKILLKK